MIITELTAKLGLEVDEAAFAKIGAALSRITTGFGAVAAAVGAVVVGAVGATVAVGRVGDEAAATAEKLSVTTQAIQSLEFAAKMSDTTVGALHGGLKFVGKNAVEAAQGSEEMAKAFAKAGVSGADLTKLKPDELLKRVATGFSRLPQGVEKTNLALQIFNRSGTELIPFLNKGAEGIEALQRRAEELGLVMSAETIKAATEFDDALNELDGALGGLRNAFAPLLPLLTQFVRKALIPMVAWLGKRLPVALTWLTEKGWPAFVDAATTVAKVLRAMAIAAAVAGVAYLVSLIPALLASAPVILAATVELLAMGAALGFIALEALAAAVPFVLLAALIVLVYDELYTFATGGKTLLGDFIKFLETPLSEDGFLLQLMKLLGAGLFDLEKFNTNFRKAWELVIGGAIDWAIEALRQFGLNIPKTISDGIKGQLGFAAGGLGALSPLGSLGSIVEGARVLANGEPLFSGGAASPSAALAAQNPFSVPAAPLTPAPRFSTSIQVSTQPGANGQEIAQQTANAMDAWYNSVLGGTAEATR